MAPERQQRAPGRHRLGVGGGAAFGIDREALRERFAALAGDLHPGVGAGGGREVGHDAAVGGRRGEGQGIGVEYRVASAKGDRDRTADAIPAAAYQGDGALRRGQFGVVAYPAQVVTLHHSHQHHRVLSEPLQALDHGKLGSHLAEGPAPRHQQGTGMLPHHPWLRIRHQPAAADVFHVSGHLPRAVGIHPAQVGPRDVRCTDAGIGLARPGSGENASDEVAQLDEAHYPVSHRARTIPLPG